MSFLLGILIFVLALLFSIMLHEAGHFVTAKKFGMKVTQFFVGFGQTLWSRRKGETEYGVKAIPAGGFVKIVGMTELEDIDPADEPRSFRRQPGWQRIIVLAAGSFMHFVLAFVLLFALAVGIGLASPGTSTTIGAVDTCVPASLTAACKPSNPASPAKQVGIRAGDKIIAVAGKPVRNWAQMGKVLRSQPAGTPVTVTVQRAGRQLTLTPSLAVIHGRRGSCSSGPGRWAPSPTRAASSARSWPGRPGWWPACPRRSRICSPRTAPTPRAARSPAWSAPRT
jgi:membrane-associated protease RseP (regulator of RpoE activity)